jgi:hypothetical protein
MLPIVLLVMPVMAEPFLGYAIPAYHPVLNSRWVGEEVGPTVQSQIMVEIDGEGRYWAQGYSRFISDGVTRLMPSWTGRLYHLSDNQFMAWNDGAEGVHGYWVIFDPTYSTAIASLFSRNAQGIESLRLMRTQGDVSAIVTIIESVRSP